MRILYLHQYFVTPNMPGSTRSFEIAKRFARAGHDVHVFTSWRDTPSPHPGWFTEEMEGFKVHWCPIPYSNSMGFGARLKAFGHFALAASRKILHVGGDVLYVSSTPLTVAIPGLIGSKLLRIPMVLEVRDLWPAVPIAIGTLRSPILKASANLLERAAYRGASHVIALSPGMAEGVARTGYSPERITVVPNACDLEMFARNSIRCRLLDELQPALGSRPVVLYCGTLGYINGLSYLVHVAEHTREIAPEIAFLVVGSGAEYQKVREQASTRGVLDRNFFMRPSVPKQEVPSLFERASVTMSTVIDVPALWDNSANKFFDSLAAGRPIVINHGGWQADILRRSGAGFAIPVQDPKAAARQLADFTRDPSRLDLASKAARRLAIDEFDRDRLVRRLISIVESVCGKPDTAAQ